MAVRRFNDFLDFYQEYENRKKNFCFMKMKLLKWNIYLYMYYFK